MNEKELLGSETAKDGFRNEEDIINKFNNWKKDKIAQEWLVIMGYILEEIEYVKAVKVGGNYKTDVQVQVTIKLKEAFDCENLSVKLVSNPQGFNQIDKREIEKYVEMWKIPKDIEEILKLFTGKTKSADTSKLKDPRRMLLSEMAVKDQEKILNFFNKNKILIISDVLKGRDKFAADWMLVILKKEEDSYEWALKDINTVMNIFGQGDVRITDQGSLKIGQIGMQRKGGDGGRESAKMLQFKINPCSLFDNDKNA
ncbi:MAG: type II restriction endonuclease [Nanoarchaeota archaeon]|nr:type II restriction endonuclease [Nanoarchaeota archaeon]MBU1004979.1 type II restriction endonuclease [Nanoarchaeota archaeon]MBU1946254.1 type II restriction endonuclease [Nanoarchaeota archaeon]